MAAANGDLPEDRRIVLRIGVNLGDVMVEGGDLYGDGVNIAARLENVAAPGGILVSGTAYDYVKNKVSAGFDELGDSDVEEYCRAGARLPHWRHAARVCRNAQISNGQAINRCAAVR